MRVVALLATSAIGLSQYPDSATERTWALTEGSSHRRRHLLLLRARLVPHPVLDTHPGPGPGTHPCPLLVPCPAWLSAPSRCPSSRDLGRAPRGRAAAPPSRASSTRPPSCARRLVPAGPGRTSRTKARGGALHAGRRRSRGRPGSSGGGSASASGGSTTVQRSLWRVGGSRTLTWPKEGGVSRGRGEWRREKGAFIGIFALALSPHTPQLFPPPTENGCDREWLVEGARARGDWSRTRAGFPLRWSASPRALLCPAGRPRTPQLTPRALAPVPGGHRAVIFDRLSGVRDKPAVEGTHLLVPWLQRAILYDVRIKVSSVFLRALASPS